MKHFRAITIAAIIFTIVQIALGAVTRLTNAGLSCPDWPLCYGMWFPGPADLEALGAGYSFSQVMAEWTHRFNAAALVGPLTLIAAFLAFRLRREVPRAWSAMIVALVLLLAQSGLGGFTVLDRNSPWSVAVHLGMALIFMAFLIVALRATERQEEPTPRGLALAGTAGAIAVLITVASGAMMAKSGATLACASWPLCDGAVIPDLTDPLVFLHFGHRVLALLTAIGLFGLFVLAQRRADEAPGFFHRARFAFFVIGVQVLAGAAIVCVFAGDSLAAQVVAGTLHQFIGVCLFAVLVWGVCGGVAGSARQPTPSVVRQAG